MNILYVEDEPNDATLVAMYFKGKPHQLQVVKSAKEAQQVLHATPDMILIDVMLSQRYEGCHLAEQLRKDGYEGPMIAITALTTPADIAYCKQVGFTKILNKPFTITQFDEVMTQYLG